MPQWAGSSWYELRYTDPHNSERFCAKENEIYWMGPRPAEHGPDDPGGVDLYVGGAEHAVLHLLYSGSGTRSCTTWVTSAPGAFPAAGQPGLHSGLRLHRRPRIVYAGRQGDERGGGFFYPGSDGESRYFRNSGKSARA